MKNMRAIIVLTIFVVNFNFGDADKTDTALIAVKNCTEEGYDSAVSTSLYHVSFLPHTPNESTIIIDVSIIIIVIFIPHYTQT